MANLNTDRNSNTTNTMQRATASAKDLVANSASAIEEVSHDLGEQAGQIVSDVSQKMNEYYDSSRTYVRQNPVKGVAVAAAAGLVAGALLSMAMRSKH